MSVLSRPDRIQLVYHAGEHGLIDVDAATAPIASMDRHFQIQGTSVVNGNCTYDAEYGLALTTAGGATDYEQCIVLPLPDADNQSLWRELTWGTDRETEWEAVVRTNTLTSLERIEAGLVLTMPAPMSEDGDNDQVKFSYLENTDTNWQVNVSIGGTDTTADSGVIVTADTVYHMAIRIDRSKQARFYLNERLVHVTTALDTANLLPTVGIQAGTATAACSMNFISMAIGRALGA
jgi:hypothetical protein